MIQCQASTFRVISELGRMSIRAFVVESNLSLLALAMIRTRLQRFSLVDGRIDARGLMRLRQLNVANLAASRNNAAGSPPIARSRPGVFA